MPGLRQPRPLTLAWTSARPAEGVVAENVAVTRFLEALRLHDLPSAHGACYGTDMPDVFFVDGRQHASIDVAKEMCRTCDIQKECLARGEDEAGIWGGSTAAERKSA